MGVISICTEGYQIAVCRCTKEHWPVPTEPCPPGHAHVGNCMNKYGVVYGAPASEDNQSALIIRTMAAHEIKSEGWEYLGAIDGNNTFVVTCLCGKTGRSIYGWRARINHSQHVADMIVEAWEEEKRHDNKRS